MPEQKEIDIGVDASTKGQIAEMVKDALDERLENIDDTDLDNVVGAAVML